MKYKKSAFEILNEKKAKLFLLYSLICGAFFAVPKLHIGLYIIIILATAFSIYKDPIYLYAVYTISIIYINNIFPAAFIIVYQLLIIFIFFLYNQQMIKKFKKSILFVTSLSIIILSYLLGYKSNINTTIQMIVCLLVVIILINSNQSFNEKNISICIWAYFCSAISLLCYFVFQFINGTINFKYGRLSFLGDIKTVSIIVAIPIIILISTKLEGKRVFNNLDFKYFDNILLIFFLGILILTAARGVILSILIAILFQLIFTQNKPVAYRKIIPIIILAIGIILISFNNESLRIERIFASEEYSSGGGRTDIWITYFSIICNSGISHILFGMGPGEISRISTIGYYAHSTFLDFFFSYGLFGFILIVYVELQLLKMAMKKKNMTIMALFISQILMFFTHGSSANVFLFSFQTILYLKLKKDRSIAIC